MDTVEVPILLYAVMIWCIGLESMALLVLVILPAVEERRNKKQQQQVKNIDIVALDILETPEVIKAEIDETENLEKRQERWNKIHAALKKGITEGKKYVDVSYASYKGIPFSMLKDTLESFGYTLESNAEHWYDEGYSINVFFKREE